MRIAICETSTEYIDYLIRLLKQIRDIEYATIVSYCEPEWLVSDVSLRIESFDILIINKDLSTHNGIYIAKEVKRINPCCQVIFLCKENRIVPDYFEVDHVYILPKCYVPTQLIIAVQKAIAILNLIDHKCFIITANSSRLRIPCQDIFYLERIQRKTHIALFNDTIATYQSPKDILGDELGIRFLQCHRSIYVNVQKVSAFRSDSFTLTNSISIPISRQFYTQIKNGFFQIAGWTETLA